MRSTRPAPTQTGGQAATALDQNTGQAALTERPESHAEIKTTIGVGGELDHLDPDVFVGRAPGAIGALNGK